MCIFMKSILFLSAQQFSTGIIGIFAYSKWHSCLLPILIRTVENWASTVMSTTARTLHAYSVVGCEYVWTLKLVPKIIMAMDRTFLACNIDGKSIA